MCRTPEDCTGIMYGNHAFPTERGGVKQMNDLIMASYAAADISYSVTQLGGGGGVGLLEG